MSAILPAAITLSLLVLVAVSIDQWIRKVKV